MSFLPALLTAALSYPPAAAAGEPAEVRLQLSNGSEGAVDASVAIRDAHGFVLAGGHA